MYLTVALLILIAKIQQIFLFLQRNMEKDTYLYKKIKIVCYNTLIYRRIISEAYLCLSLSPVISH